MIPTRAREERFWPPKDRNEGKARVGSDLQKVLPREARGAAIFPARK